MKISDIFRALEKCRVNYCLIGRSAAVLYGLVDDTLVLDILLDRTESNARKFYRVLERLNVVKSIPSKMEIELFLTQKLSRYAVGDYVFDVLKWQKGFPKVAWKRVKRINIHGTKVRIADLHDLIQTKAQSPRRKDQLDARRLKRLLNDGSRKS